MLDLGTSFLASVERDPGAIAIAEGDQTITYADWYRRISALVDGLGQIGLRKGDTLVTAMQNRWENASLHWACQLAGIVITPVNWRVTADELDHALRDSATRVLVHDDAASDAVAGSVLAQGLKVIPLGGDQGLAALLAGHAPDAVPQAAAEDLSVMLYTSGTTSKPKGVPRRHRAERAAAVAHVAQNLYHHGERTLGVMPLYHTMGIRSLLSASVIGGAFICQPRFDVPDALDAIETYRVTNLYLVPTLYHDIVHHAAFTPQRVASVRKLGFAGASMTDGLLQKLAEAFQPDLFVNHYGSSEIYTFSICQDAAAKPGSAGRAAINQRLRVVPLGSADASKICAPGEEGEIVASMQGDEAFEGYWNRPEADRKAIRDGWYFTGDCGHFDDEGDLFVTGRADDMIITGGENVSPVEVESCLSLHPAVAEVAVVGLPDARWGKVVTAFVKRAGDVTEDDLDAHCRSSDLSNFRRPRRYVFVTEIPKSPVGKLLRRLLVAGEYELEPTETTPA
ncbi:AMP-binding protein [Roseivivax sp.]